MQSGQQKNAVKDFFNNISKEYSKKYSKENPFHKWYFSERLKIATSGYLFHQKRILDIGTGTGALYAYLVGQGVTNMDFIGCDIADKMMESSPIPKENRFAGPCYAINCKGRPFDHIFVLGVTTYMDEEERNKTFEYIANNLCKSGVVVCSFTNKIALNTLLIRLARPLIRLINSKRHVAGQPFDTFTYSEKGALKLFGNKFTVERVEFINQTFFPFVHLFPNGSVRFARFIQHVVRWVPLLDFLSAEFIVVAVLK